MALEQPLLEILACPDTHHAPLTYDEAGQTLTCTECGRVFPIRDDLPILLLDEATGGPADDTSGGDTSGSTGPAAGGIDGKDPS